MEPTLTVVGREAIDHDELLVHDWRVAQLKRLGIPGPLAERAAASHLDWDQIAGLVQPRDPKVGRATAAEPRRRYQRSRTFDTADGRMAFSGDTTANDDLIVLAQGADILVHHVADLGRLERRGMTTAAPGSAGTRRRMLAAVVAPAGKRGAWPYLPAVGAHLQASQPGCSFAGDLTQPESDQHKVRP